VRVPLLGLLPGDDQPDLPRGRQAGHLRLHEVQSRVPGGRGHEAGVSAPHLPGCRPIISRKGGFEVLVGYRCEDGCPQHDEWISNLVSPEAKLKAAMEYIQRTYGMRLHSGWHTWPKASPPGPE
jgi:hypothetical protein